MNDFLRQLFVFLIGVSCGLLSLFWARIGTVTRHYSTTNQVVAAARNFVDLKNRRNPDATRDEIETAYDQLEYWTCLNSAGLPGAGAGLSTDEAILREQGRRAENPYL